MKCVIAVLVCLLIAVHSKSLGLTEAAMQPAGSGGNQVEVEERAKKPAAKKPAAKKPAAKKPAAKKPAAKKPAAKML